MKHQKHNRRFLLLLTILLVATFGMAQTVIVKVTDFAGFIGSSANVRQMSGRKFVCQT